MSIPGEKATRRDPRSIGDWKWKRRRCIYDIEFEVAGAKGRHRQNEGVSV